MRSLIIPFLLVLVLAGCGASQSASTTSSNGSSASSTPNGSSSPTAQNHVHSIVILPNNPNTIFLGAHYRLYKSTDGGKAWHALTKQMMLSMAMDASHPVDLYAVSLQHGLVKTTDSGLQWTPLTNGVPAGRATGVVAGPVGGTVLAYGNGIYRTVDAGARWTNVQQGHSISSAAFGANGAAYAAAGDGLFVSSDSGQHWHMVRSIGNQPVIQVVAGGLSAYAVTAVGIFRTTDGGKSWTTLSTAPAGVEFMGLAPSNPNEMLAEVGGKGFYASYNGGTTWQRANTGIRDTNFNASTIRIAPRAPNVAYTGAWGLHFYATHDAGRHWTQVSTLTH